jgi:ATP-dependent RNA helicase DDX55/SPB4
MLQNKEIVDKSQEAFVSYLRYYKEHQLQFIFNSALLDIGNVANAFALFKVPRVKEILGKRLDSFKSAKLTHEEIN